METIITAATVMAMYFNVSTSNGGNYAYNADVENNKVMSISVFDKNGKYLSQKLQYRFTYDSQNRLESREALKWNSATQRWENYYKLDYAYTETGYILSRSNWNRETAAYDKASEKTNYTMVGSNLLAVNHYEKSVDGEDFQHVSNIMVMNPQSEMLLAVNDELRK